MAHIGLIVAEPLGYSETFFRLDIQTWEKLGYQVSVFPVNQGTPNTHAPDIAAAPPARLSTNLIKRGFQLIALATKLFTHWPFLLTALRFIKAESQDRHTFREVLGKLYANQHILSASSIDILIFGYGNLAVTRENLGKALKANTIVSFKGADVSIFPFRFDQNIYQNLFKKDFLYYFVSKGLRNKAHNWGFPIDAPSYIIPAYIDESSMPPPKHENSVRPVLSMLAVGRLDWIKGHIYLIMAMKHLRDSGVKLNLRIIGDGPQYESLFWACKTFDLLEQVTFPGVLPKAAVLQEMKQANVLVHPSLSEGTPNVVLEALYLKLPCIVANWPGADELISHRWNGWIAEKRDPEALAREINTFRQRSLYEISIITANGHDTIKQTFNANTQQCAFQKLLADALPNN